ncbi:regulator of chromosome condensation 1/beta-lactamase-inhibitor protein II [Poronia punctata]|nr:regulator of chromosome condensation 1/beta-lactamase-inhibitor protein II [Poronia punctata]
MDLYVSGFNAWRQLDFHPPSGDRATEEPDDVVTFRKVLSERLIEVQYADLTSTIVNTSSGLRYAGSFGDGLESDIKQRLLSGTAAIAGNGLIAVYDGIDTVTQHPLLPSPGSEKVQTYSGMGDIVQLVAYETGFAALARTGKVWTWGDERYAAPLGREITTTSPAVRPGLVNDLDDLPSGKVKKIDAAGYTVLALTDGNDLYFWGGHPARGPILGDISSSPAPVDMGDKDIVDCSVGEAHIIVLTSDGYVYVVGENTNGQLGVPLEKTTSWHRVTLPLSPEHAIVGVKAGRRSSLIITQNTYHA